MITIQGKLLAKKIRGRGAVMSMALLFKVKQDDSYQPLVVLLSSDSNQLVHLEHKLNDNDFVTLEGEQLASWVLNEEQVGLLEVNENQQLTNEFTELPEKINCKSFEQFSIHVDDRDIQSLTQNSLDVNFVNVGE